MEKLKAERSQLKSQFNYEEVFYAKTMFMFQFVRSYW